MLRETFCLATEIMDFPLPEYNARFHSGLPQLLVQIQRANYWRNKAAGVEKSCKDHLPYRDLLVTFYKGGHLQFEAECREYKTVLTSLLKESLGPDNFPAGSREHDEYWNLVASQVRFMVKVSNRRQFTIKKMIFLELPLRFENWPEMPCYLYHPFLNMLREADLDDSCIDMFCFM